MTDNPESAVIDRIDALVDDQLEQESSGYDHNINQPDCPWCGFSWHGMRSEETGCPGAYATEEDLQQYADNVCAALAEFSGLLFGENGIDGFIETMQEIITAVLSPIQGLIDFITDLFDIDFTEVVNNVLCPGGMLDSSQPIIDLPDEVVSELLESTGTEAPPL